MKYSFFSKKIIKRFKRQAINWEDFFGNTYNQKELIFRIYEEFLQVRKISMIKRQQKEKKAEDMKKLLLKRGSTKSQ